MPRAVIRTCLKSHLRSFVRAISFKVIGLLVFTALSYTSYAQDEITTDTLKKKKILSLSGISVASISSYAYLHSVWYDDIESEKFHFYNDLPQWNGMDKAGHICTAYNLSKGSSSYFRKYGWKEKSPLMGAAFGFTYTSTLEILDGHAKEWGFSVSDLSANFLGSSLYLLQDKLLENQLVNLKWSYHNSKFAEVNPGLLGSANSEKVLKDYNGQTYWMSLGLISPSRKKENRWICLSLGYSINGFTRARTSQVPSKYRPASEYLLSLDVDWSKVPIRNKYLKGILKTLNFVKIPFPALQWDKNQNFTFHPIYF